MQREALQSGTKSQQELRGIQDEKIRIEGELSNMKHQIDSLNRDNTSKNQQLETLTEVFDQIFKSNYYY